MLLRMLAATGAMIAAPALAQVTIPSEFETTTASLGPLSAYFGGVAAFGTELSATTIHSGGSLRCWANFRHDNFFHVAGFAFGTLGVTRASGGLVFGSAADTFSITIQSPPPPYVSGQLRLIIDLREDDDGDGVIDTVEADDQWESVAGGIPVLSGTNVYNIPLAQLVDADPLVGNNVQNFGTTGMMAMVLSFETRNTYPGGIIESPTSLLIDHVGLYVGAQTLPPTTCPADINGIDGVTVQDLFDFLTLWFGHDARADLNGIDGVTVEDLFTFLIRWFTPCP